MGIIGGNFGTETLVNVNNTIQGSGNVGNFSLAIMNQSVINANVSGGTLTVLPNSNGITNTGVMQASSGGTLSIVGMTNNSGLIEATGAGSIVETNGATINGGNLTTTNGGLIQNSGTATLTAVTITPGSTFQGNNGSTTFLTPSRGRP